VPAVDGCNAKAPLTAGANAVPLHQPLHALLAHANALSSKLPPEARSFCRQFCVAKHKDAFRHSAHFWHMAVNTVDHNSP
jgi:hypothetical protein